MTAKYTTPAARIAELVAEYGSYAEAAAMTGACRVTMMHVVNGKVHQPRAAFLEAIGLDPQTGAFKDLR